jgi:hypothetical protein
MAGSLKDTWGAEIREDRLAHVVHVPKVGGCERHMHLTRQNVVGRVNLTRNTRGRCCRPSA